MWSCPNLVILPLMLQCGHPKQITNQLVYKHCIKCNAYIKYQRYYSQSDGSGWELKFINLSTTHGASHH